MQQETTKTKKGQSKTAPTKALTTETKRENAVVNSTDFKSGGWDQEVVDTKDIIIPKILLMHPTSDMVKKGVRNIGEIIKSTSGDVIATRGNTFEVLVFDKWKDWKIEKKNDTTDRYEYVRMEPWTLENDSLPWDYEENGEVFRRNKTMNFYGILAKEAGNTSAFPVRLSFSRTGFKTGIKIADAYARALMEKQPPTRQLFKIGSELVTGKGSGDSYFAFTVEAGTSSTEIQQAIALKWRQTVQSAKAKNAVVDHEVDDTEEKQTSTDEF